MVTERWVLMLRPVVVGKKRWAAYPSDNGRLHWAVRHKIKKAWLEQTWALCKQAGVPHMERAHIVFTHYRVRDVDRDNRTASIKPCLDGIVRAGVLDDDNDAHVDMPIPGLVRVAHFDEERIEVEITRA